MKVSKLGLCCIAGILVIILCVNIIMKRINNYEIKHKDITVELIADKDGKVIISGYDGTGSIFKLNLSCDIEYVRLKDYYFIDFTDDNSQELCLEMSIWNSVSPDFNTIIIYDMKNGNMLFPTSGKSFIYDAYIERIEDDGVLRNAIMYSSYTKLEGVSIENERSIFAWKEDSFELLDYESKLLAQTDQYLVFLKKDSLNATLYYIEIVHPQTLETIQEFKLMLNKFNMIEKVRDQELVQLINDGSNDLYIYGYGIQYWEEAKFK